MTRRLLACVAFFVVLVSGSTLAYPPPEPIDPSQKMPYIDPTTAPSGCRVPYGYSAACGYYASNTGGECKCRDGGADTTLCMKSNAGTGCGLYESQNDDCCRSTDAF